MDASTIGAYEAKTHLSSLLERVEAGEAFTITKHGRPVARLVPAAPARDRAAIRAAIEEILAFRAGNRLAGLSWKELRDDGRKY